MVHRGAQPFLTTDQAADYVRLSRRTLEKMRVIGDGPLYRKHGRSQCLVESARSTLDVRRRRAAHIAVSGDRRCAQIGS
jgi:hypothetical protein